MRQVYSHAQLTAHIALLIQPTPEDLCPPEKAIILAGVMALDPKLQYVVVDENDDEQSPQWLYLLPQEEVVTWDGSAEGSFGYGGIRTFATAYGRGFSFYAGGSGLQSACTTWIVPAEGYAVAQYE